jgi:hypothetical protein
MGTVLKLYQLGTMGVNVDSDPISLKDQELRLAQNAIRDPLGNDSGLKKRPGLLIFNTILTVGIILGGIGVPLVDLSLNGAQDLFIGRGPTS